MEMTVEPECAPPINDNTMFLHVEDESCSSLERAQVPCVVCNHDADEPRTDFTIDMWPSIPLGLSIESKQVLARRVPIDDKVRSFRITKPNCVIVDGGWRELRFEGIIREVEPGDTGLWRLHIRSTGSIEYVRK